MGINFKLPKITLSDADRVGFLTGTAPIRGFDNALKAVGASKTPLAKPFEDASNKVSDWSQSMWEGVSGKTTRQNAELAGREAETARRNEMVREMGARQQADVTSLAGLSRGAGANSGSYNNSSPGGIIGANLNTAGTF